MTVSLRGSARRFENRTGALSVRNVFFGGGAGTRQLHGRLETSARHGDQFRRVRVHLRVDGEVRADVVARPDSDPAQSGRRHLRRDDGDAAPDVGHGDPEPVEQSLCHWPERGELLHAHVRRGLRGEQRAPRGAGPRWSRQTNMTLWHTTDSGDVAAHEFGHMHGNPDEYTAAPAPSQPGEHRHGHGQQLRCRSAAPDGTPRHQRGIQHRLSARRGLRGKPSEPVHPNLNARNEG